MNLRPTLMLAVLAPIACAQTGEGPNDSKGGGGWSRIAVEEQAFNVAPGTTVRYGSGGIYKSRRVSGAGSCTNDFFGGDPTPNVAKTCESQGGLLAAPKGPTLYFSAKGSNSAAGTQTAPKRDASGVNLSTLGPGAQLLFERGGTYAWGCRIVENLNVTPEQPLVIDAWGTGAAPTFNVTGSCAINFGSYANTNQDDGGYVFRNVRFVGPGGNSTAFFFVFSVHDIVFENVEVTNFYKAFESQSRQAGVRRFILRNSNISRNHGMGINGSFSDSVIEGNLFEGNNFSGSGFDHAIYLSGGTSNMESRNNVIRNNHFLNNSVVNGRCTGGQVTFHGQLDGMLIEGNVIESPNAKNTCWHMSITQAYDSAEWFRNFVVRNNKSYYPGNTGFNAQSAPGIVFEGNVIVTNQPSIGIGVGHGEYQNGDVADGDAVVRNNTVCYQGASGLGVRLRNAPRSTNEGNAVRSGAEASTGVCAKDPQAGVKAGVK